MCHCEVYGFQAVYCMIGRINQNVWVWNRVSFFMKLTSWLKILLRLNNSKRIIAAKFKLKKLSLNSTSVDMWLSKNGTGYY